MRFKTLRTTVFLFTFNVDYPFRMWSVVVRSEVQWNAMYFFLRFDSTIKVGYDIGSAEKTNRDKRLTDCTCLYTDTYIASLTIAMLYPTIFLLFKQTNKKQKHIWHSTVLMMFISVSLLTLFSCVLLVCDCVLVRNVFCVSSCPCDSSSK